MNTTRTRGRPPAEGEARTEQLTIKFTESVVERLDRYVAELRKQSPGLDVTRAAAVRTLVMLGLDRFETQAPKK